MITDSKVLPGDNNWSYRRLPFSISLPFFTGKRSCVGESLAYMELFIILMTLLKNFTFSCVEGPDSINLIPQYSGFANIPHIYEIIATPRWRGFSCFKENLYSFHDSFFAGQIIFFKDIRYILDIIFMHFPPYNKCNKWSIMYIQNEIKQYEIKISNKISFNLQVCAFYYFFPHAKLY